jgi:hypothetical protein
MVLEHGVVRRRVGERDGPELIVGAPPDHEVLVREAAIAIHIDLADGQLQFIFPKKCSKVIAQLLEVGEGDPATPVLLVLFEDLSHERLRGFGLECTGSVEILRRL